jgi:hypothetical protein
MPKSLVSGTTYRILNPDAPRIVADGDIADVAMRIQLEAASRSPHDTGELAGGYRVVKLGESHYAVVNDVPYAIYVEYGTVDMQADPVFGRAIAVARRAMR